MESAGTWPLVVSLIAFVLVYIGIFIEKVHRTIIALSGAALMIALGSWFGFYNTHSAFASVDFDTITLLMGMMIVVGLFKETGFFQYLAIRAAKLARGRPWLLLVYLGLVTSVVSMVLDNVTTIIIVVPVTVSVADVLGISALPFLMGEVLLSNIGGVATLIGDPPNILIGSAAGFGFLDFIVHLAPVVIVVWIASQGLLLLIFRRELKHQPSNVDRLMGMDARRAIVDPLTTRRMLIALAATILLFFTHEAIGLDPGIVALIGACIGLLWVKPNFDDVLKDIHWDVLLFFISLFIIVGGLEASGALAVLGRSITALTEHGVYLAVIAVLWISALASGVISNVPFTIAMLPILKGLAVQGVAVAPLWWALALGVGFGANLTPLGSAANVMIVSLSESLGDKLTFRRWLSQGTLIGFLGCAVGTIAIVAAVTFGWV
ncbi:ArsB/NhaD family transporter [Candidatus Bipolaricaulota bacterium]|nr:ArsB/NhaD family transporter [Candidatus Bipolaricaulota bacterium]